jgi:putative nucleotidyltransferase with HDIG domain
VKQEIFMLSAKDIFKKVDKLSKKEKIPVYVVGGYVRDFLLEKKDTQDLDFVVEGSGLQFAKLFDESVGQSGSLVEFPDFDTARYVFADEENEFILEFAGARSESYEKTSRKPIVQKTNLESDLSRRDFTVNAMAVSVSDFANSKSLSSSSISKKVIDPFNGMKDLKEKVLKTPLESGATFNDDPLRMMRAIRFAGQLNFSIEPKTLSAIYDNRDRIKIISAERIREELVKMLKIHSPSVCFTLLFQTKLMDLILPEITALDGVEEVYGHQHKNNLIHTFKVIDNVSENSDNALLRFAGLLHDIGKPKTKKFVPGTGWAFHGHEFVGEKMVEKICKRLRFSSEESEYIKKIVRWHQQPINLMDDGITDSALRRLAVALGRDLKDLLILGRSDITTGNPIKKQRRLKNYDNLEKRIAEVIEKDKLDAFQSPVRGDEIMSVCGLKPGPTVGKIKTDIEEAILDGKIPNEYEAAKEYFLKIKNNYLLSALDWEKI